MGFNGVIVNLSSSSPFGCAIENSCVEAASYGTYGRVMIWVARVYLYFNHIAMWTKNDPPPFDHSGRACNAQVHFANLVAVQLHLSNVVQDHFASLKQYNASWWYLSERNSTISTCSIATTDSANVSEISGSRRCKFGG